MRWLRQCWSSSITWGLAISLVVGGLVVGVRTKGWLEPLELAAYDLSLAIEPKPSDYAPPITLITITEADIQRLRHWPLTDAMLATVLQLLLDLSPRVIGFDIYRDLPVPPGHAQFNALMRANRNVVGIMKYGPVAKGGIAPPPVLAKSDQIGFSDIVVDADGRVRRGLLFLDDGRTVSSSFALIVALRYLEEEGIGLLPDPQAPAFLKIGRTTFPPLEPNDGAYVEVDTRGYQVLLDFPHGSFVFPTYTVGDVLDGKIPIEAIRDRIVLLGVVAEGVKDYFLMATHHDGWRVHRVPGLELHAGIVSQIVHAALLGKPPRQFVADQGESSWILGWAALGSVSGFLVGGLWSFVVVAFGGFLLIGILVLVAFILGWWLPSVPAMLAWGGAISLMTAYKINKEKRERQLVERLFSPYVAPEVAQAIWLNRKQLFDRGRLRPQMLVATVLFCDLEGFTPVAESMDPEGLMEWLNAYMDEMTKVISDHGGVVDDYYGDAIKANFGVPFHRTDERAIGDDAIKAVRCAMAMERTMNDMMMNWRINRSPALRLRIGLCTGSVMAGSVGSDRRLKYTTVGDIVNIAARLESLHKESHTSFPGERVCRILIAESTKRYVEGLWPLDDIGEIHVKGKRQPVHVYHVLPSAGSKALGPE